MIRWPKTNEHAFEEDIKQAPLVVVDFFADWCGPCKMMAPVLEQLERDFSVKEYRGRVKFLSVDVEHHRKLAEDRNVMNLPTLMIFENGVAKEKVVGYRKYGDLKRYLKEKLAEVRSRVDPAFLRGRKGGNFMRCMTCGKCRHETLTGVYLVFMG